AIGAVTLRYQMTHDQIKDVRQLDNLTTLLDDGGKQGVKVQFTFRDNANQAAGKVLTGEKLKEPSTDITKVVKNKCSRS
ncbi:type III effector, partial [Pseudomonas syringae pv. tagetis]